MEIFLILYLSVKMTCTISICSNNKYHQASFYQGILFSQQFENIYYHSKFMQCFCHGEIIDVHNKPIATLSYTKFHEASLNSFELSQVINFNGQTEGQTDRQREGKHIVPSRVNSGRSLKIETNWVAQKTAQLVKYLTLLHEFEWQYLTACPSVFLFTTNHFAQHVQKKAFQCQNVPMVEFEAIFRIFGGAAKI